MDELKEAFDYQADGHVFLGSPQSMLRDMRFDDVSMPPEPDDEPVEKRGDRRQRREDIKAVPPKYNEDQLAVMPEWIGASKKMFSVMNDGERFIGSDKQAAAYGLDLMSEFNWNMTGPAGIPGESGISVPGFAFQVAALMSDNAGEENAMTFLQMLHTYSDTSTNGATIKRAFRGIFADPLTYAGGIGKLYAMGAKSIAGKVSGSLLKDTLMKTAAGTAMPYDLAVKYPGRTGMVAGAGYGAGFEGGTMAVEDAAGLGPTVGEAATRLGTAGTVGAAVGGVGSKVLSGAIPAAGSAVRQGLDTAGQAAEARMAKRGPITDRLMSGGDPMDVIDPALAAAGKLVKPTKENPVTAVAPTETEPGIIAFHGSGADFDQFSLEKIGTGEGAQAYGYGLYFTDSEDIAKFYRDAVGGKNINRIKQFDDIGQALKGKMTLTTDIINNIIDKKIKVSSLPKEAQSSVKEILKRKEPPTTKKMYKVGLTPKPDELLDYDAPFSEQSKDVQEKLIKAGYKVDANTSGSGSMILDAIMSDIAKKETAPRNARLDEINIELKTLAKEIDKYSKSGYRNFTDPKGKAAAEKYDALMDERANLPKFSKSDARKIASEKIAKAGIPGIKYRAAGSRGAAIDEADAEKNYVIFDDKAIKILEKYGIVGPVAITALGAAKQESADNGDT